MAHQIEASTDRPQPSLGAGMLKLGLFLVAAVAIVYAAKLTAVRFRSRPLQPLADYTLAHGEPAPMPPEVATFFSIPHDGKPLEFRELKAGTHDGRIHSFAVRVRPDSGDVDILLQDSDPKGAGYHYRTSTDGRLISALHSDTELRKVDDAKERYAIEVKKWLEYLETVGRIN